MTAICGTASPKFPEAAKPVTAPQKPNIQSNPESVPIKATPKGESFPKSGDTDRKNAAAAIEMLLKKLKSLSLTRETAFKLFSVKIIPFKYYCYYCNT